MTKRYIRRLHLATAEGIQWWEAESGLNSPAKAAKALGLPLRTYHRYKAEGLPQRLQREIILDRMEAALPKGRRGSAAHFTFQKNKSHE